jgi:hypothetical protein
MMRAARRCAEVVGGGQAEHGADTAHQQASAAIDPSILLPISPGRKTELIVPDCRTYTHERTVLPRETRQ